VINNTDEYVSLMKSRASGALPDMGSALRAAALIKEMPSRLFEKKKVNVLDVGCATGHFFRTSIRQNLAFSKYVGLEIDAAMLRAARDVWADAIKSGTAEFLNEDVERYTGERKFDFVVCINAFMYFASAKVALRNLMRATRHHLLVRSYFTDSNYRIIRAQTKANHDKSQVNEIDAFDDDGNIACYDFWNIYSYSYIEAVVASIDPEAKVEWIDDKNVLSSMEQERELNVNKRGATEVLDGYEISYPFILPWKYLSITMNGG
jgi:SAM-dependent methyltransferase